MRLYVVAEGLSPLKIEKCSNDKNGHTRHVLSKNRLRHIFSQDRNSTCGERHSPESMELQKFPFPENLMRCGTHSYFAIPLCFTLCFSMHSFMRAYSALGDIDR